MANYPHLQNEQALWKSGVRYVFGVDEAGRGCLAGPVCAAVSAWEPQEHSNLPVLVRDSKQMTEAHREAIFHPIQNLSLAYGVGFASSQEIDQWNILRATYLAVARSLERGLASLVNRGKIIMGQMNPSSFAFLSDGNHPLVSHARSFVFSMEYGAEFPLCREIFSTPLNETCFIKGDSNIFSIASASVLAKVSRDHLMLELDKSFPEYQFALHKGYSTAKHIENLNKVGPCSEHRYTFSPVANAARDRNLV